MEKLLVKFRHPLTQAERQEIGDFAKQNNGRVKRHYKYIAAAAVEIPKEKVSELSKHPKVEAVYPDGQVQALDAELDNSWGVKHIGAGLVHDEGNKGAGIKIAIIDTGIDYNHPDLADNYAGGYDFVNEDDDPWDDHYHGTHCSGITAARDNDAGVVGVAPEARLYALKVLNQYGSGNWSDVIAAVEWCIDNGIQVTSNSYGGSGYNELLEQAFQRAYDAGIIHIAAAGNSGADTDRVLYPAKYTSVIAVAATDPNDNRASFSSTGPAVELAAPGVSVYSCMPNNAYAYKSGTSMACPHVAGLAALVMFAEPNLSNAEVRTRLEQTAKDLGEPGRDNYFGFGLVDALAATVPPEPGVYVGLESDKGEYFEGEESAVLVAAVRDETGQPITSLPVSAFVTQVNGAPATVIFEEVEAGIYFGSLDISEFPERSYDVDVEVTDSRGLTGTGSCSFTIVAIKKVIAESTEFVPVERGKSGKHKLTLDVAVVSNEGQRLSTALVTANITPPDFHERLYQDYTDSTGKVTLAVKGKQSPGLWKAQVTDISKPGYVFDPSLGDTDDEIEFGG